MKLIKELEVAGSMADTLERSIQKWQRAADGDSNDAEHDAAFQMSEVSKLLISSVRAILGGS